MMQISNHDMRLLWLQSHHLHTTNNKKLDVLQTVKDLGFIQIDSIQNVTRAHHHILWSRNKNYREHMIDDLLKEKGKIFEHFTHDASLLPVEFYPMWKWKFQRNKERFGKSMYYKDASDADTMQEIIDKIKKEGALNIKDFNSKKIDEKKMWSRTPHKITLDYMWHCGILATAYRKNFRKYYDLSENVIPKNILTQDIPENQQIDWLCMKALDAMSVASAKEIKNFWEVLSIQEVQTWLKNNTEHFLEIQWENNQGKYIQSFATLGIEERLQSLKNSKSRVQIINPFDPAIRDRLRLKNIFGFDYKIEIFVPKMKRKWGYYVYPILQGNRFIGRIELQAERKTNKLNVVNFWKEEGGIWTDIQQKKLDTELSDFAALVGISKVCW